jgi:hypothetical protein
MVELAGLVAHRARRVQLRSALKNQLLGQVDRCFPGLAGCLGDLLGTKVGRLVVVEFADPARLARLGPARLRAFAARRGVLVAGKVAERLVAAARVALPTDQAGVARRVLADDLALLAGLDTQISAVEQRLAVLCPPPRSRCCAACRAGPPCGWRPTPPRSVTRVAGPRPARSTGPPGSPRSCMRRLGGAATARSAERARCRCAGPYWTSALGFGIATRQPRPMPPACGRAANPAGDRDRAGPPGQPDRLCHGP